MEDAVWSRHENDGFVSVPRVLPLILVLISNLVEKGNPSRVYLDLWCRVFDEGYIEVKDEEELAYSAGYVGSRAARSWRDHILKLEELGFLRVAPKGVRRIGYILIVGPFVAVRLLRDTSPAKVEDRWWNAFVSRAQQIGAVIPSSDVAARKLTPMRNQDAFGGGASAKLPNS
jgi:hypothetical protein